jgi:hypothetical protein
MMPEFGGKQGPEKRGKEWGELVREVFAILSAYPEGLGIVIDQERLLQQESVRIPCASFRDKLGISSD